MVTRTPCSDQQWIFLQLHVQFFQRDLQFSSNLHRGLGRSPTVGAQFAVRNHSCAFFGHIGVWHRQSMMGRLKHGLVQLRPCHFDLLQHQQVHLLFLLHPHLSFLHLPPMLFVVYLQELMNDLESHLVLVIFLDLAYLLCRVQRLLPS